MGNSDSKGELQLKCRAYEAGLQGVRPTMEDTHIVTKLQKHPITFYGIYDGHGGIQGRLSSCII